MSNDDHDRLIRVAANWYGLYNELFVKAQRLTIERDELLAEVRRWQESYPVIAAREGRARALISWIDGACVDETPHMEIRAAINRYWESQK